MMVICAHMLLLLHLFMMPLLLLLLKHLLLQHLLLLLLLLFSLFDGMRQSILVMIVRHAVKHDDFCNTRSIHCFK